MGKKKIPLSTRPALCSLAPSRYVLKPVKAASFLKGLFPIAVCRAICVACSYRNASSRMVMDTNVRWTLRSAVLTMVYGAAYVVATETRDIVSPFQRNLRPYPHPPPPGPQGAGGMEASPSVRNEHTNRANGKGRRSECKLPLIIARLFAEQRRFIRTAASNRFPCQIVPNHPMGRVILQFLLVNAQASEYYCSTPHDDQR